MRKNSYLGRETHYVEDSSHRFVCQNDTLNGGDVNLQIGMLVCGYDPGFDTNIAVSRLTSLDGKTIYQLCLASRQNPRIDYLSQAREGIGCNRNLLTHWQYVGRGLNLLVPNVGKSEEISLAIMTSLKQAVAMHFAASRCLFDVIQDAQLLDLYLEKIHQPKRNIHDISSNFFGLTYATLPE